jgi:hypothetical protein
VLVMPFLPGGTLADRVATTGPLPASEAEYLLDSLLEALAAAHRQGVIHRDIKPDNILFDATGRPALADFGVATARDLTAGLTAAGLVVGTPTFMAPEQARGEPATIASDVFSLGATILFALTGAGPHGDGDARAVLWRAAQGRVAPLPASIPSALRKRLRAMLDPRPSRRPSAAAARGGITGTGVRWRFRERPVLAAALLTAGLLLTSGVALWASRGRELEAASPSPGHEPCVPLPYRPCGAPPAPFTDGRVCIADHADYDGIAANGCEAAPDTVEDGVALDRSVSANLVPAEDVDTFELRVDDGFQFFCDGALRVALTAPAGTTQRLEIVDSTGRVLDSATSTDGERARVVIYESSCGGDDSTVLTARVTTVRGHSAQPYSIVRSGSF